MTTAYEDQLVRARDEYRGAMRIFTFVITFTVVMILVIMIYFNQIPLKYSLITMFITMIVVFTSGSVAYQAKIKANTIEDFMTLYVLSKINKEEAQDGTKKRKKA